MSAIPTSPALSRRTYLAGCLLTLAAGTLWSFGGLMVRIGGEASLWQYMVYRSGGQFVVLLLWSFWSGSRTNLAGFVAAGPHVWIGSQLMALSAFAFVFAMQSTAVANVLLITACTPLMAALIARATIGERIDAMTVAALALATAGLVLMVNGDSGPGDMLGNAMALVGALAFACYTVQLRRGPELDWQPAIFGFALTALVVSTAMVVIEGQSFRLPGPAMLAALAHGGVLIGIGNLLYIAGSKHVPAAELSLLAQCESILGPLWVWLLMSETPPPTTLLGGALILLAVFGKAMTGAWRLPPRAAD